MTAIPQVPAPQCWHETPNGIVLAIKAQPGAKRTAIGAIIPAQASPGWPPARLKVAVSAPPEDGRANTAIAAALAKHFGLKPAAVSLQSGAAARDKKFHLSGNPAALAALAALAAQTAQASLPS